MNNNNTIQLLSRCSFILFFISFFSCNDNDINSINLDFEAVQETSQGTNTLVNQPLRLGINIERDKNNTFPISTTFEYNSPGEVALQDKAIENNEKIEHDYHQDPTLWFDYTPKEAGTHVIKVTLANEKISKEIQFHITANAIGYSIDSLKIPEHPLIDQDIELSLVLTASDSSNINEVSASAVITEGSGKLMIDNYIINNENARAPLRVGKNKLIYIPRSPGKNNIRLKLENALGHTQEIDIPLNVELPDWEIAFSSIDSAIVSRDTRFTLTITETDQFNGNTFTGNIRFAQNAGNIIINNREITHNTEFSINSGINDIIFNSPNLGEVNIEFTVSDKYGTSRTENLVFKVVQHPLRVELSSDGRASQDYLSSLNITLSELFPQDLTLEIPYKLTWKYATPNGQNRIVKEEFKTLSVSIPANTLQKRIVIERPGEMVSGANAVLATFLKQEPTVSGKDITTKLEFNYSGGGFE